MDVKEFGQYLKELRLIQSLSTHKLAELSGVSQSYISHVESGRKSNVPSPEILKKLAKPLKVNPLILLKHAGHLPDISPIERERISVNYDAQVQLEPQLEEALQVITNGNDFIDEVRNDIKELEKRYDNHLEIDEKITPQFLMDLASNFDWDQEWVLILIEDIASIARKHRQKLYDGKISRKEGISQVQLVKQAKENYKNNITTPIFLNDDNEGNFFFFKDSEAIDESTQQKIREFIQILLRKEN